MFERTRHYLLLLAVTSALFLPNLGRHSLWDVDEAHNAECVREMIEADDWCVPTFNFKLRIDKPIMHYWVMRMAYLGFGVSEWSARIGSVLASMASVLLVYELGRRMFDGRTGLLAAILLASSILFCVASHAATPDAPLILFTLLTFVAFWNSYERGSRSWLLTIGITTGLAVLTKGPVGVLLPVATIGLFLLWERRLSELWDVRLLGGLLLLAAVVLPWYLYVGVETKWEFWRGFFGKHNFRRFQEPLEGHHGPFFYHPLALLVGFAPWSAFLLLAFVTEEGGNIQDGRQTRRLWKSSFLLHPSSFRFLTCWLGVWLLLFSLAATKLPNYLLPAYPALAIFIARLLMRLQTGNVPLVSRWWKAALAAFGVTGVAVGAGLVVLSGELPIPGLENRTIPHLAPWAAVGLLPLAGAILAWPRRNRHTSQADNLQLSICNYQFAICGSGVAFVALLAAVGPVLVDGYKAPAALAAEVERHQLAHEIQIGCTACYRPGLVFYTRHEIRWLNDQKAIDMLRYPCQTFLIVPTRNWVEIRRQLDVPAYVLASQRDFPSAQELLLITNRIEKKND